MNRITMIRIGTYLGLVGVSILVVVKVSYAVLDIDMAPAENFVLFLPIFVAVGMTSYAVFVKKDAGPAGV